MEPNKIGAPNSDPRFDFSDDDTIENLLRLEPSDFNISDFPDLPFTLPVLSPPLPPATAEIPIGSNSMPAALEEPQLPSLSSDSDQPYGIRMPSVGAYGGGNNDGEIVPRLSVSINSSTSSCVKRKAFTNEQLVELANTNPKKAKRIIANRKSAARSKDRKTCYAVELEKKVQSLRMEADNINKEYEMLEIRNEYLRSENNMFKNRIQAMFEEEEKLIAFKKSLKEQQRILQIKIDENSVLMGNCPSVAELVAQFSSQLALQNTKLQFQTAPSQQPLLFVPPPPPPPPPRRFGEPLREHFIGSNNPLN